MAGAGPPLAEESAAACLVQGGRWMQGPARQRTPPSHPQAGAVGDGLDAQVEVSSV